MAELQTTIELSDLEKMEEAVLTLRKAVALREQLFNQDASSLRAKLNLYSAMYDRGLAISETIGSTAVAQEVVRSNIPGWTEAIALAYAEGFLV